ncbi:MAG TPA: protein kinase [Thermoanaerobaculia bacterium]
MDDEHWRRTEELFHAALEFAPEERPAFLDRYCGTDRDLRQQVDVLLSKEKEAGSFLETPVIEDLTVSITTAGLQPGRQFGPHRIVSRLGAGGMGEVYRAHDEELDRDVAIKTLPPEFARDPERMARFRREARTLASLNHPNIAAIYGLEESGDLDCLVLELVEGETLRGPLPVETALNYAHQVAQALEASHTKGIIHRDLKPANVKVTPEGKVKVLDFGLARAILGHDEDVVRSSSTTAIAPVTLTGHLIGTPGYMSPEQARGKALDNRTDIWAFGCLLFELLTGKRAFAGETIADTIAAVLEREPDWNALPAKTPTRIRELLRHCLQKDAALRLGDIAIARRTIEEVRRGSNRWRLAAITAAALAIGAIAIGLWLRNSTHLADRSQWVALTNFPDSVAQPALSPDGRMLTFIRGSSSFFGPGQIFVKTLPNGEAKQLTHDASAKMSPAFSPDGTRIAYTTIRNFKWNTWTVPTAGGEPKLWLVNAAGLVWSGPHELLFADMRRAPHMGIVIADERGIHRRDVYLPAHKHAMAHRAYLSPDRKSVLLVEMDKDHLWMPCYLMPMDGSSTGRQVGPAGAACTFAAWSPDGKWMYLTSEAGGANHIWRQRFPDGVPEQITSGPTEEEGVAMAPDGRSLVTAVSLASVSAWIHDASGERPISLEGNTTDPKFSRDGGQVFYRIVKRTPNERRYMGAESGEVWTMDLRSGRTQRVVSGMQVVDYDISADGRQLVIETAASGGKPQLWIAPLDRRSPPRLIPDVAGRTPRFGSTGEVFFQDSGITYRVGPDGKDLRKATAEETVLFTDVSPDGGWIVAWSPIPGGMGSHAFPMNGGPAVRITGTYIMWEWSPDGRSIALSGPPISEGRSYIIPVPAGRSLPELPAEGLRSEEDVASLPGARRVDVQGLVPGASPDVYAFYRGATHRNLYRVPIP